MIYVICCPIDLHLAMGAGVRQMPRHQTTTPMTFVTSPTDSRPAPALRDRCNFRSLSISLLPYPRHPMPIPPSARPTYHTDGRRRAAYRNNSNLAPPPRQVRLLLTFRRHLVQLALCKHAAPVCEQRIDVSVCSSRLQLATKLLTVSESIKRCEVG